VSCYRLIDAEKPHHQVSRLCRVLGVARAGYHAWASRPPSQRTLEDAYLGEQVRQIHARSRGTMARHACMPNSGWAWTSMSAANGSPG
jgi:putative transposase